MAATPDGGGYWLVAADGGIFSYGDAAFAGSAGCAPPQRAGRRHGGVAPTAAATGWSARDGGIFTYGDATFEGSAGALRLDAPVTGMAATPDGGGYWLVARDGGVFTYGDAALLRFARRDDPARPRGGPGRRGSGGGLLAGRRLASPWPARWSGSTPATTA